MEHIIFIGIEVIATQSVFLKGAIEWSTNDVCVHFSTWHACIMPGMIPALQLLSNFTWTNSFFFYLEDF